MPFSKSGNLILLKAKVDSTEGTFILDSGCPYLVLNITYFRDYSRVVSQVDETNGIAGSIPGVEHTIVKEVEFGTIHSYNMNTDLVNLGHIENTRGVKILGLIGMYFLTDCEMIIDYERNLIHFHIIGKGDAKTYKHQSLSDESKYNTIPFDLVENKIIVTTQMADRKLRLIIDCAAESNLLDSRLPNKVFENLNITGRIVLTGVGNKKVEAIKANFKNFKIGNTNFQSLPFIITNLEKTCFSNFGCIDGVPRFRFPGITENRV